MNDRQTYTQPHTRANIITENTTNRSQYDKIEYFVEKLNKNTKGNNNFLREIARKILSRQ